MKERTLGMAAGAAVTLAVVALHLAGAFEWLELRAYDLRYALTPPPPFQTPIVLVRIDEDAEAELNRRATDIGRAMYARAVKHLSDAGAALIVFDVIFSRPGDPAEDAEFARAIEAAGNVILARYIGEREHIVPLESLRAAELGEALINAFLDSDGVLRGTALIALDYSDSSEPEPVLALPLEAARHYLFPGQDPELELGHESEVGLGPLRIPSPDGHMRINFYGPPATFPRVSFAKVVKGELAPGQFKDKIVLIGASAPSLHDYYQTPYTERLVVALTGGMATARGLRTDGFEIHANAIQTILDKRFVVRSKDHRGLVPGLLVVLGLVGTALILLAHRTPGWVAAAWAVLLAGVLAAAVLLFWRSRYWLDVVPLTALVVGQFAAGVVYQRYLEGRKRRQVEAMFGRYVSRQVTEFLVKYPDMANPSGRKERLTIFFSDIRGFTSMSEKMEAQEVQKLLGEYFTEMTRILFRHGGTLDKFMGDAIMAFFGNPEPQPDHARRAVLMALEMQQAIVRLNAGWAAQGRQTIGVGIGVNTGEATVGNLGSVDFLDYTVIGDSVNLACRLEQYAAAGEVIISQSTFEEVKDAVEVESRDPIKVKGKAEPIPIYRVSGLRA